MAYGATRAIAFVHQSRQLMDRIYLFLIHNRVWIYILSAFGLVWYIGELIRAQRALGRAMFNLERETATRLRNHALSFVLFFVTVVGVVYYVNRFVAPDLPEEVLSPLTPTPDRPCSPRQQRYLGQWSRPSPIRCRPTTSPPPQRPSPVASPY